MLLYEQEMSLYKEESIDGQFSDASVDHVAEINNNDISLMVDAAGRYSEEDIMEDKLEKDADAHFN